MEHYVPSRFCVPKTTRLASGFRNTKKAAPAGGAVRKNLCGYAGASADGERPGKGLAGAGGKDFVLALLIDAVGPAVPGFHADKTFGILLPQHGMRELRFVKGDGHGVAVAGVMQDHRALDAGQQPGGIGAAGRAGQGDGFGRSRLRADSAFGTGGGLDRKRDIFQLGRCKIRMEANAVRHFLVASVLHPQRQRSGRPGQGVAHGELEVKRVAEFGQPIGGEGQFDRFVLRLGNRPGQQVGKAVDFDRVGLSAEHMHAAFRLAAAREQNRDAAAGAVGRFKVFIPQPEVFVAVLLERDGHAALFRGDGQRIGAVGEGEGLVADAVFFIDAGGTDGHRYLLWTLKKQ